MRAFLVALTLVATAAPALAHEGHDPGRGLHLTDLVVSFDPLTQAQLYSFTLNNTFEIPSGALFASVTSHDAMVPRNNIAVGGSLAALELKAFTVSVPLSIAVNGCVAISATGTGHQGFSNRECATTVGITQLPVTQATIATPATLA